MIYHEKDLPQKSSDWIKFRQDKLGTSEIPIIRGKFPTIWCDDYELFLRKMGKPHIFSNKYIEDGNEYEPIARELVEKYLNKEIDGDQIYNRLEKDHFNNIKFEQYTVQHKNYSNIFSSFDGIDIQNKIILEIKCPSEETFKKILKNRKPTVPKIYYDQVQGQLSVANSHWEVESGIFAVFFDKGIEFKDKINKKTRLIRLILIQTELNQEYCKEMLQICEKYCNMINERRWIKNWNK